MGGFELAIEPVAGRAPEPFSLKGWQVLLIALGFFGAVITANGVMLTAAIGTMPGAETRSAYDASQRYNRDIAEARMQTAMGWRAEIDASTAAVALSLSDRTGAPLTGREVIVTLAHPASRSRDRRLPLTETEPGRYAAAGPFKPGAVDAVTEVRSEGEIIFRSRNRIVLR
jgi:nitrogen fixation protein FixH